MKKVGHYAYKFPHKKGKNEYDHKEKDEYRKVKKGNNFKKKSFYTQEDKNSSEDEDEQIFDEERINRCMLMSIENQDDRQDVYDLDEDKVIIDLEGELVTALEDIQRLMKKNKKKKELLIKH